MTGVVIDASVVVKLLIDEDHSDRAQALSANTLSAEKLLFAPPLMPSEVTNVLFQRTRRQQNTISSSHADSALANFLLLPFSTRSAARVVPPSPGVRARVWAASNIRLRVRRAG